MRNPHLLLTTHFSRKDVQKAVKTGESSQMLMPLHIDVFVGPAGGNDFEGKNGSGTFEEIQVAIKSGLLFRDAFKSKVGSRLP